MPRTDPQRSEPEVLVGEESVLSTVTSFVALVAMLFGVARCAQRDQVIFRIVAGVAAELSVVHLKVSHRATRLTPPAVATQDLLAQPLIR